MALLSSSQTRFKSGFARTAQVIGMLALFASCRPQPAATVKTYTAELQAQGQQSITVRISNAQGSGTYFKDTTEQQGDLAREGRTDEYCFVPNSLSVTAYVLSRNERGHIKVQVGSFGDDKVAADSVGSQKNQQVNCSFRQGYFFKGHVQVSGSSEAMNPSQNRFVTPQSQKQNQSQVATTTSSSSDFERVMESILKWEGGCSDHPNDNGGRTYMGITTQRARMNGFTGDVCTMPKSQVLQIYKTDYWDKRAVNYPWPLNLAVMNTEVNSGGGKAQEFLNRMKSSSVANATPKEQAIWYVAQQTAYYRAIVAYNGTQRVFLQGWLNRSNDITARIQREGDIPTQAVASAAQSLRQPSLQVASPSEPARSGENENVLAGGEQAVFSREFV